MIIRDEPIDVYHRSDAIGSGDIRAFLRSPQLYLDQINGLCKRKSDALAFGSVAHMALLEPDRFATCVVIEPEDVDFRSKEGKAWKAANMHATILSGDEHAHLTRMQQRMPGEVRRLLDAHPTREATVRPVLDGLLIQCRPDAWDESGNRIVDLKTIGSIDGIDREIYRWGYHVQLAWYALTIATETGAKRPASSLVFVEKLPPYRWRIVDLDPDYQALAIADIDRAWAGILECQRTDNWTDPGEVRVIASPPRWANDDFNDESEVA